MENLEIHSLVCKKDLLMAVNCINSLLVYEEFKNVEIFFHEDGSLNDSDFKILKNLSPKIQVIERKFADENIKPFLANLPNCERYRLGSKKDVYLWHKIKTFDYFFFSKTKNILGMDSDLLFLKKPVQVIDFIQRKQSFYFPDVKSSYSFNEPEDEVPVLHNVNTGLIYIPGEEYYDVNSIEVALSNLIRDEINYFPAWIEQSAFAHMFYKIGKYERLDPKKNRIPFFQDVDNNIAECLHFVSYPAVRKLYKSYVDFLSLDRSEVFCEKSVGVNFREKNIKMDIKVSRSRDFLIFEYFWGIEKVKIPALSHCFKVIKDGKEEIFEFGSSETGFFIVENRFDSLEIQHTYDWYGEKKWEKIDLELGGI
jgi:hypothetical protein